MINSLTRALTRVALPALVVAGAYLLVPLLAALPPTLSGLRVYGPYLVLAAGALIALWFNRGRAVFGLLCLSIAYLAYHLLLSRGIEGFTERSIYAALTIFVPFNLALFSLLREQGIFNFQGFRRLLLIGGEVAFTGWVVAMPKAEIAELAWQRMIEPPIPGVSQIPHLGVAMLAFGLLLVLIKGFSSRSPVDLGIAGALVAFTIACQNVAVPNMFAVFVSAAAIVLVLSVLQESYRMAFRDELTGLASRGALNERLEALGKTYAIAMLDVDHFKKFNDTYGHDVGDQVLKMVAAHIENVGGGGRAYRFGGEEFTVLFPGKSLRDAWPHLDALRAEIAHYRMALRAEDRPKQAKAGRTQRGASRGEKSVSVSVSIGVAERSDKYPTAAEVLKAADKALYRAKERGRNRVSR